MSAIGFVEFSHYDGFLGISKNLIKTFHQLFRQLKNLLYEKKRKGKEKKSVGEKEKKEKKQEKSEKSDNL